MKLHILCDLHLEFGLCEIPRIDVDAVILAGDIHNKRHAVKWINDKFNHIHVIYVLGNHEFYGDKFPRLIEKIKADATNSNIHVLENDIIEIAGFNFFGCTLLTYMALM